MVYIGNNDVRKPHQHVPTLSAFCSPQKAVLVLERSSMIALNDSVHFKAVNFQTIEPKLPM